MAKISDLTGERFGALVAVAVEQRPGQRPLWTCRCDCGQSVRATNGELRAGRRVDCSACARRRQREANIRAGFGVKGEESVTFKHGGAQRGQHTREYRAWAAMIRRCEMPSQDSYPLYGGRGIKVCAEWRRDFAAFLRDIGPAPSQKHTLEREDSDRDYEPGNVRWATAKEQASNKRGTVKIEYRGERMPLVQWADVVGVKYPTLWARLYVHHWPVERAFGTP